MNGEYTAEQIAEFEQKKAAADERRAAKQQAAEDRAEAIERGEDVEPIRRNGRQGAGEWREGVYRMDNFDVDEYLRIVNAKSPEPVDPETAFLAKLALKFPDLSPLDKEEFLTAACSRLFDNDLDKLLSEACRLLVSYQWPKVVQCGELVSRYRRLPAVSGSSQTIEDL